MAKITQASVYNLEIDDWDIRLLDYLICVFKDTVNRGGHEYVGQEKFELPHRLESLHDEILRVRRDGHA